MDTLIGIDIGGTFTDCVAISSMHGVVTAKSLSTKQDPVEGIFHGLEVLAETLGQSPKQLLASASRFSHGTTIGTNLIVERNGARLGLLTTKGHGDVLSMMRGNGRVAGLAVDQIYNIRNTNKPVPLVPRTRVKEITERTDKFGNIVVTPDEEQLRRIIIDLLEKEHIEALAISFLWSFRNDQNERAAKAIAHELAPDLFVSISSEVSPRLGEFERTVATVINAYVGPKSSTYLSTADRRLRAAGLNAPFLIMQSSGGVLPIKLAETAPISLIDSGPSGGVIGSQSLAKQLEHNNVITTDMGGTSFDVSLIIDGVGQLSDKRVVEQYTYQLPHIDVRAIAAGGGSIARYDWPTQSLRVGPDSAGSEPGPACYGRGGLQPTVTDADVVLGLIRPEGFLGGSMPLDYDAAYRSVAQLANQLKIGVHETAAGIIRINNHAAATLIRQQTIEKSRDPRDFVLYAYGGAGPVHAFGFAHELGIREVVIPLGNSASTLSAYGIAQSDITRILEREEFQTAPFDFSELNLHFESLEKQLQGEFKEYEWDKNTLRFERVAVMRFAGQMLLHVPILLAGDSAKENRSKALVSKFLERYQQRYGSTQGLEHHPVEIATIRVNAIVSLSTPELNVQSGTERDFEVIKTQDVLWPSTMQYAKTTVYSGLSLPNNEFIAGPAVVELPQTSICVGPDQRLKRDSTGSFRLFIEH